VSAPEDLHGALVAAEADANRSFDERPVGSGMLPCGRRSHWVEFELLDEGEPAAGLRYELRLPGRVVTGELNGRGRVRVEGIAEEGTCTIVFPQLDAEAGDESEEGATESEEAPEGSVLYVPGKTPEPVALDASHRYHLPGWDLVEIAANAPAAPATPAPGALAPGPAEQEELDEEEDDWDVVSIGFADPGA
jgi:hypothetical protein